MNFHLTDEQTLLQQTVRQLGEMGLMGIMVPEKWGGAGMDTIAYTIAMETEAARLLVRRAAKITQVYEGTSEIQRVVIARELQKKG